MQICVFFTWFKKPAVSLPHYFIQLFEHTFHSAICLHFFSAFYLHLDSAVCLHVLQVMRLFQYLTMVLMSTYHHAELTRSASVSALHDLFHVIISILLEPKMEQLADGAQLLRLDLVA